MRVKRLKFEAHPEKGAVSGILIRPRGSKAIVVLAHGAGAGMEHSNMEAIAQSLCENRIASLRYQFPFMERGGGRDSQNVSVATVVNAVKLARKKTRGLKIFAGGHSFGGRMTSHAAAENLLPDVEGLIFFAFPLHAPGRPGNERANHLAEVQQPMLFLSGNRDQFLDLKQFKPVLKKLGKKATFHPLDTANHSYKILKKTRKSDLDVFEEMGIVCSEWMMKHFQ